jgi:hypothetical protein
MIISKEQTTETNLSGFPFVFLSFIFTLKCILLTISTEHFDLKTPFTYDMVHFYLFGKPGKFVRSKPVSSADADR